MSRIGKQPVTIPAGVKVNQKGSHTLQIEGPKGKIEKSFHPDMTITVDDGDKEVRVERPTNRKEHRQLHGLTRALIANMVEGVTEGYEKKLEVQGLGYTCNVTSKKITLNVGFCHPVELEVPEGLDADSPARGQIHLTGVDKQLIGQFAAEIRRVRPPEPYKGKGIRYVGEVVRRKQGKAFGK